jgi:hypothetical protein
MPNTIGLRVNRRLIPPFTIAAGAWTEHTVTVELDEDVARVDLLPEAILVPADTSPPSPDRRVLGLAVARLELR